MPERKREISKIGPEHKVKFALGEALFDVTHQFSVEHVGESPHSKKEFKGANLIFESDSNSRSSVLKGRAAHLLTETGEVRKVVLLNNLIRIREGDRVTDTRNPLVATKNELLNPESVKKLLKKD